MKIIYDSKYFRLPTGYKKFQCFIKISNTCCGGLFNNCKFAHAIHTCTSSYFEFIIAKWWLSLINEEGLIEYATHMIIHVISHLFDDLLLWCQEVYTSEWSICIKNLYCRLLYCHLKLPKRISRHLFWFFCVGSLWHIHKNKLGSGRCS